MKTAEEILDRLIIDDDYFNVIYKKDCIEAMEEYAQERTKDCYPKEFVEWVAIEEFKLNNILKNKTLWCSNNYPQLYDRTLDEIFTYWKENIKQ